MTHENSSFFPNREGMDLSTPHGEAQARLDEMFEVAKKHGIRVTYAGPKPHQDPKPIPEQTKAYFAERDRFKRENPTLFKTSKPSQGL